MDVREGVVGQRRCSLDALLDEIGCRVHLAGPQVVDDRSGLLIGGVPALLEWIEIPVPSIVDPAVFEATRVQLE